MDLAIDLLVRLVGETCHADPDDDDAFHFDDDTTSVCKSCDIILIRALLDPALDPHDDVNSRFSILHWSGR